MLIVTNWSFKQNSCRTERRKCRIFTSPSILYTDVTNPIVPLASSASILDSLVNQITTDGSAYQSAVSAVAASLVGFRDTDCAGSLPDSLYGVCSFIPDDTPFLPVLPLSMVSNTLELSVDFMKADQLI